MKKPTKTSKVQEIFDDEGNLKDDSVNERVDGFLSELVWMSKTMNENMTVAKSVTHKANRTNFG